MLNPATRMRCLECGQEFDLLNSPWPKPEGNTKWLHTSGTGHEHYRVLYADGTEKNKILPAPVQAVSGVRFRCGLAKEVR